MSAHQVYYSLIGREYEWELMPLGDRSEAGGASVEPARMGSPDRERFAVASRCRQAAGSQKSRTGRAAG